MAGCYSHPHLYYCGGALPKIVHCELIQLDTTPLPCNLHVKVSLTRLGIFVSPTAMLLKLCRTEADYFINFHWSGCRANDPEDFNLNH